jgi:hypothetical protein
MSIIIILVLLIFFFLLIDLGCSGDEVVPRSLVVGVLLPVVAAALSGSSSRSIRLLKMDLMVK